MPEKEVQGGLPRSQSEAPPSRQLTAYVQRKKQGSLERPLTVCDSLPQGRPELMVQPGRAEFWGSPVANTWTRARPSMETGSHHLGVPATLPSRSHSPRRPPHHSLLPHNHFLYLLAFTWGQYPSLCLHVPAALLPNTALTQLLSAAD